MDLIRNWLGLQRKENDLQIQVTNSDDIASKPSITAIENPSKDLNLHVQMPKKGELVSINTSFFSITKSPIQTLHETNSESEIPLVKTSPESQVNPENVKNEAKDSKQEVVQSPVKNCMSCKAIGVGTLSTAVVFVLYNGIQNQNNYKGFKRFAFIGQYVFLSASLALTTVLVLFDLGPLKDKQKGETMLDLAKDDLSYFRKKMAQLSSSESTK